MPSITRLTRYALDRLRNRPLRRLAVRQRRRLFEQLESRALLAGVVMHSATADGGQQLTLTYEVSREESRIDFSVYRSSDALFGGDTLIDSVALMDPADLSLGLHSKNIAIGSAVNQLALPGAGASEVSSDYYLLFVANPSALESDATAVFQGIYHPPAGGVYVHGSDSSDSITVDSTFRVSLNGQTRQYTAADVSTFRVRAHAGNDVLQAATAAKNVWASGAAGDDTLIGGNAGDTLLGDDGNDTLNGGKGNDVLNGSQGSDTYVVSGVGSGLDNLNDTGTVGVDLLVAGSVNTTIVLSATFSQATTGLELISANGFAGLTLGGTTGVENWNFNGIGLSGVSMIDPNASADSLTASAGDDFIRGGLGNDSIDGGPGRDTVHFSGMAASYSIVPVGSAVRVTDLAPTVNGDDGADMLVNVETLKFLDSVIQLNTILNSPPVATPDAFSISEDAGPAVVPVLANDTDADLGDTKRVVSVTSAGVRGIVQVATGGTGVLFYPNKAYEFLRAGDSIVETIQYTMSDAVGAQSTSSLEVTVIGANDAPLAVGDGTSIHEDSAAISVDVLVNDSDVDSGDTKSVVSVDGSGVPDNWELVMIYGVGAPVLIPGVPAIRGTVAVAADGASVVYSVGNAFQHLLAGQTATERFRYTIRDAAGALSTNWVTITVTGNNDAPLAAADSLSVGKNAAPISVNVLSNDFDIDVGDTKRLLAVDSTGLLGSVIIAPDGKSLSYAVGEAFLGLASDQTALETFRYTMVDGAGSSSTTTVTIRVDGANQVPVANTDAATTHEDATVIAIDVLANDTDLNPGDTKTIVAVNGTGLRGSVAVAPGGQSVNYSVGSTFQSLAAGTTALEVFRYTMRDGAGAESTAEVTVTITGNNDAPLATANSVSTSEDAPGLFIDVLANDSDVDVGDSRRVVSVSSLGLAGSVTLASDGLGVHYAVGGAFQSLKVGASAKEVFSYTMADASGAQSTASVTVTIAGTNDAPVAWDNAISLSEDAPATSIAVLTNDTDVDAGDTKRVLSVSGIGLLGTASVSANGTAVMYSVGDAYQHLVSGQTATETFTYTMIDGGGLQSTASVHVTIQGSTDGPKAVPDNALVPEDSGPIYLSLLANDFHDLNPGSPLTLASIDGNGSPATLELIMIYGVGVGFFNPGFPAVKGSIAIAPDGRGVLYSPFQSLKAGETGNDFFRYTIRDSEGRSSTAIVALTVSGANDAPVAVADTLTLAHDALPITFNALANDTDADSLDTKTLSSIDTVGLRGTASMAANGTIQYSAAGAFAGLTFGQTATETMRYTMTDSAGLRSTTSIAITIVGKNQAPLAAADTAATHEDGPPVTLAVLSNDSDPDAAAGDTMSVEALSTDGVQGTVSFAADRKSLIYSVGNAFQSLKEGETAIEVFAYTMKDSQGLASSASVTVTVTGRNDAPQAVANTYSLSEDASPTSLLVLSNDRDVDANDSSRITSVTNGSAQGTLAISADGQSILFTVAPVHQALNAGQSVVETFSYTIADSAGAESTAGVSVTIVGANEPVVYVVPPAPPVGAILGTAGNDLLVTAAAADIIFGRAGDDEINSQAGSDVIFGEAGRDQIDGGAGNDTINGGADRDDLTGGDGADIFKYYLASESTAAAFDRIRDFDADQGDKIDLNLIDASTVVGGNNDFVVVPSFSGTAGQLILVSTGAGIYQIRADVNGDSLVDLQIEIKSKKPLLSSDLIL